MSTSNQRWRERRATFRPSAELIDPSHYGVEVIPDDTTAKLFVERHHYSAAFPSARVRVGLYRSRAWFTPELVGVAVFGVPMSEAVLPKWTGHGSDGAIELSRFVLLDDVEGNGETWFLARAFRALRRLRPELGAVLAFSDPVARIAADGRVVTPGHIGEIYQAHNGRYVGRANRATKYATPSGVDITKPVLDKVARGCRGHVYAEAKLRAIGAPVRWPGESGESYVARVQASGLLRPYRHPGNLAYVWPLAAGVVLPGEAQPYPKADALVRAA